MTDYDLPEGYRHLYSGKVRDLYEGPNGQLLFIASDRISAYDWVLPTPIPDKGRILTQLSLWWFDRMQGVVPNHLVSTQVPKSVRGRAMLCEPLEMMPVECVVRGYLAGSGLTEYNATRAICGNGLPPGLKDGSKLPKPIFTPATKAPMGEHDVNITYDETIVLVGQEEAQDLKRLSLDVYRRAAAIAEERGLILADTKFEFGIARAGRWAGRMVLGDGMADHVELGGECGHAPRLCDREPATARSGPPPDGIPGDAGGRDGRRGLAAPAGRIHGIPGRRRERGIEA